MSAPVSMLHFLQGSSDWSPVPLMGVGTIIAIVGGALNFGMMKSRTDDIPAWRMEMREDLERIRIENRESQAEIRADIRELRRSISELDRRDRGSGGDT